MLLWLAPIPVLWLAPRVSAGQAFLVAAAAYVLGGFNIWFYMSMVTPIWVALLNAIVPACLFATAVVLFRHRAVRGRLWQAALIFPAFWVTYEYVTSLVSIHGTIGNISYSQMNFVPILQLAAVTGIWGISFSILFFAATVAALLGQRSSPAEAGSRGDGGGVLPLCLRLRILAPGEIAEKRTHGQGRSAGFGRFADGAGVHARADALDVRPVR